MDCHHAHRLIWEAEIDEPVRSHVEHCADCRAEERRAGEMRAALVGIRSELAVPPADLEGILLSLAERSRWRRMRDVVGDRPTLWGGAAAAAAAAAFGVIVARRLLRPDLAA